MKTLLPLCVALLMSCQADTLSAPEDPGPTEGEGEGVAPAPGGSEAEGEVEPPAPVEGEGEGEAAPPDPPAGGAGEGEGEVPPDPPDPPDPDDDTPPTVIGKVPDQGDEGVDTLTTVTVTFSEAVDCGTVTGQVFQLLKGAEPWPSGVACDGDTAVLTPDRELDGQQRYAVRLSGAEQVTDRAGNAMEQDVAWLFTTGFKPDRIAPPPPGIDDPAPPGEPTNAISVTVGGAKEPGADVEGRGLLDGEVRAGWDWRQLAPGRAPSSWSFEFPLELGTNRFELRSSDQSGNTSEIVAFEVVREQRLNPVDQPTVDDPITPTTVADPVLTGTKPADHALVLGGEVVVPRGPQTRWDLQVALELGDNTLSFQAQDDAGNLSDPVEVAIRRDAAETLRGGGLEIEFELRSLWNDIGDEMGTSNPGGRFRPCCEHLDHYAAVAWLEGPLPYRRDAQGGVTAERCHFDADSRQRKYTRYARTLMKTRGERHNLPGWRQDNGFWNWRNFVMPNWMAALIESGAWEDPGGPHHIPRDVDRRADDGSSHWPAGNDAGGRFNEGPCPQTFVGRTQRIDGQNVQVCDPKMMFAHDIDGMTEASTHEFKCCPNPDPAGANSVCNGQRPAWCSGDGADTLGMRVYPKRWQLDLAGLDLPAGAYVLTVEAAVDRIAGAVHNNPARNAQWLRVKATDRETCWDDPEHDAEGSHRLQVLVVLDGANAAQVYAEERSFPETVDACAEAGGGNDTRCNCGNRRDWPCPGYEPVDDGRRGRANRIGERVRFFTPDLFVDAGGASHAARVTYTP